MKKQSFGDVLHNRYSEKFCKFHRKRPLWKSLFDKVAGLQAEISKNIFSYRVRLVAASAVTSKYCSSPLRETEPLKVVLCGFKIPLWLFYKCCLSAIFQNFIFRDTRKYNKYNVLIYEIFKEIAPQGVCNDRILLMIKRFIQNLVKHP